tara:strand:- start:372 stop:617 length:246 start_codon:yes stop_codon:yes gene_type:complete
MKYLCKKEYYNRYKGEITFHKDHWYNMSLYKNSTDWTVLGFHPIAHVESNVLYWKIGKDLLRDYFYTKAEVRELEIDKVLY